MRVVNTNRSGLSPIRPTTLTLSQLGAHVVVGPNLHFFLTLGLQTAKIVEALKMKVNSVKKYRNSIKYLGKYLYMYKTRLMFN